MLNVKLLININIKMQGSKTLTLLKKLWLEDSYTAVRALEPKLQIHLALPPVSAKTSLSEQLASSMAERATVTRWTNTVWLSIFLPYFVSLP